jgi:hypothetical protein
MVSIATLVSFRPTSSPPSGSLQRMSLERNRNVLEIISKKHRIELICTAQGHHQMKSVDQLNKSGHRSPNANTHDYPLKYLSSDSVKVLDLS